MKKLIFSSFLIALSIMSNGQEEQLLEWSPIKRLTWNDYLAEPSSSSDIAAITSTVLRMEYSIRNNILSYKISCQFLKTRSWGKYKTDYILKHEQGHFDITEIFARKLARELKEYKFNPRKYQDDLGKIYKRLMEEEEEFQHRYDIETDYSRNKERQGEWLKKIDNELSKIIN